MNGKRKSRDPYESDDNDHKKKRIDSEEDIECVDSRGKKRKSSDSGNSDGEIKKIILAEDSVAKCFRNDDCVRAILKYLPMYDLVNIAQSSCSLKRNAEIVFNTVHDATINFLYDPENYPKQQKILQQFGRLTKKMWVLMPPALTESGNIFNNNGDRVLRNIGHFCQGNLQDMTLVGFQIDLDSSIYSNKDRTDIQALLGNLNKLELIFVCTGTGFFQWTKSLKEIKLHSCCEMSDLFDQTLPQLKKMTIGACPSSPILPDNKFNYFLENNPTLERMSYQFFNLSDDHFKSMCALPHLTHLEITLLSTVDLSPIAIAGKLSDLIVVVGDDNHRRFSNMRKLLPTGCQFSIKKL